jgi:hypothetical protein
VPASTLRSVSGVEAFDDRHREAAYSEIGVTTPVARS